MKQQETVVGRLCNLLRTDGILLYTCGDGYGNHEDLSFQDGYGNQPGGLHGEMFG